MRSCLWTPSLPLSLASSVFILSRKPEPIMFESSRVKQIFLSLQSDLCSTRRRSLSKSMPLYLLWTLIGNTIQPSIQATNLESMVLPAPDTPRSRR